MALRYRTRSARETVDSKARLVLICRKSWPTYVTMEEDFLLMKEKWKVKYEGVRVVMWDDTNISFAYQPSTALNQRITYSSYYSENCAKGGVFLQLCGWLGVMNLWSGATSDSHYQRETEIFQRQEEYSKWDLVNNDITAFTTILDKGYQVTLAAWQAGKQMIKQPVFAKCDTKFSGKETLTSASVATDQSGNERAVNVAKKSGFVKRGLQSNACPVWLDNIWCAFSFQANFMYKPVL